MVVGDNSVGKTWLLNRYISNEKPEENIPPTIGVDHMTKVVNLKTGETVKVSLWDTVGQDKYKSIIKG